MLIDQWSPNHSLEELLQVTNHILGTLAHLHDHGVVHGDIKPSNVLVSESGQPKILDLGIASMSEERRKKFRGTLGYVAPEVLKGQPPTPESDLYGLGALLYQCICGIAPFPAPDPAALTYIPLITLPITPSSLRVDITTALDLILLKLLCRDPARRGGPATAVQQAIRQSMDGEQAIPVLGMHAQRDQLYRSIMAALDGETRILVIYAAPGSGRRTLITEAVRAARIQGMRPIKGEAISAYLSATKSESRPPVLALHGHDESASVVAKQMAKRNLPGLLLIRSNRPLPELNEIAEHMTLPPLLVENAIALGNRFGVNEKVASNVWSETSGHPSALVNRLAQMSENTPASTSKLTRTSKAILKTLERTSEMPIATLAAELGLHEHDLLDHCGQLLATGRVKTNRSHIMLNRQPGQRAP